MKGLLVGLALVIATAGQVAAQQTYRVDTFDRYGKRTGYIIVNPQTGRTDSYDHLSNHTGTGQITPPPAQIQPGQAVTIQPGTVIKR